MFRNCIRYALALVFSIGLINSVNGTSVELTKHDLTTFQEIVELAKEKNMSEADLVSLIKEQCEKEDAQNFDSIVLAINNCLVHGNVSTDSCFGLGLMTGGVTVSLAFVICGIAFLGLSIYIRGCCISDVGVDDSDSSFSEDDSHED